MPSRVLGFGRSPASSDTPSLSREKILNSHKHTTTESRRPSSTMDLFHHHKDHLKDKRQSWSGKSPSGSKTGSPSLAASKPAKLNISMESPPLVFYGTAAHSTGALLSGLLMLDVSESEVKLSTLEMELQARLNTRKPVSKDCPQCATKTTDLFRWNFITEATTYKQGAHSFPFSYLLPGDLPISTKGCLGSVEYILYAKSTTSLHDTLIFERELKIQRAVMPGIERTATRVFPPTNISANFILTPVIHPIGAFPVQMRMTGVVDKTEGKDLKRRWRIRKMDWHIEEHSKVVSAACPKHAHKVGGEGKGIVNTDSRHIGGEEVKGGWKADYDVEGGEIDLEFSPSVNPNSKPLCDVDSPTGITVKHTFAVEIIVAEEYCPTKLIKQPSPTGTARILRMSVTVVLTERAGLGISWDEEQPPVYDDVPASPPTYAIVEDYHGEPLPEEDLSGLGH
ncbi:hypothetical protein MMC06_002768 [Schaereria dolodes]|nr:hypothetical protein [Schaereria dolodes]